MKYILVVSLFAIFIQACQAPAENTTPLVETLPSSTSTKLSSTPSAVEENQSNIIPANNEYDIVFVDDNNTIHIMDQNGKIIKKVIVSNPDLLILPWIKWSPDKKHIAFAQLVDSKNFSIFIMSREGTNLRYVNSTILEIGLPVFEWSPDGKSIAATGISGLYIINTISGEYTHYDETREFYNVTWSPDSSKITVGDFGEIFIIDANKKELQQTISVNQYGYGYVQNVFWSPDGKKLAFVIKDLPTCEDTDFYCSGIFTINSDGTEFIQLASGPNIYNLKGWTSNGKYVLYEVKESNKPYAILINTESLEINRIIEDGDLSDLSSYELSSDGKYILYRKHGNLCQLEIDELTESCFNFTEGTYLFDW